MDRLIAHHLVDQVGATFNGRISGATRAGLFIALDDTGADGFVPAATIGADYYHYDESRQALIGSRTGEMHRIGDRVEVRLVEAAPVAGALRFELLSAGTRIKGARRPGRKGPGRNEAGRSPGRPSGRKSSYGRDKV